VKTLKHGAGRILLCNLVISGKRRAHYVNLDKKVLLLRHLHELKLLVELLLLCLVAKTLVNKIVG